MIEIIKPIIAAGVRHALTYFGLSNIVTDNGDALIGAILVLLGFGWSLWQKRKEITEALNNPEEAKPNE